MNTNWPERRSNTAVDAGGTALPLAVTQNRRLDVTNRSYPLVVDLNLRSLKNLRLGCSEIGCSEIDCRHLSSNSLSAHFQAAPSASVAPQPQTSSQPRRSSFKKNSRRRTTEEGEGENAAEDTTYGMKKSVSFSRLEIRSYEQVLGDTVPADGGAPVSLGWNYDPSTTEIVSVDDYESLSGEAKISHEGMLLLKEERELILLQGGYSWGDVRDAEKGCRRVLQKRRRSYERAKRDEAIARAVEKCKRRMSPLLRKKSSREKLVGAPRRGSANPH
uniref:Uncharacterized protein n=1 Tax=Odontella aurita TaxID=265563 RepID=A0A7S4IKB0_9STRA|mmetsp:Transcript_26401/g.78071  ORF Transcript_26401/g.78071 Transcript_26401/m.78071 type:complete len:274 (+) Transcript_26401:56-877(+)